VTTETGPLAAPFRLARRWEPWAHEHCTPRPCPVCGKWWKPWPGSVLPCHGRCLWTEAAAVALIRDPRTQIQLARDLGVSISVVRAGYRVGAACGATPGTNS